MSSLFFDLSDLYNGSLSTILAYFHYFWGQMPIFSWVTPTFLPLNSFLIWFFTSSEKKKDVVGEKNSHLTPKTSLRLGFWGQMPFFSWVSLIKFQIRQWERALQSLTGSLLLPWRKKKWYKKSITIFPVLWIIFISPEWNASET